MAKAATCDRCGAFFVPERTEYQQYGIVQFNDTTRLDICPKCYSELNTWFEHEIPFEPDNTTE